MEDQEYELGNTTEDWDKLTHPDDWPWVKKSLMDHFEGKTSCYEEEFRAKTRWGEWKWILEHGRVVKRDEKGKPTQAIGTHVDITDIKAKEFKLRESEEKFRSLVENAPFGMAIINDNENIKYRKKVQNEWVKIKSEAPDGNNIQAKTLQIYSKNEEEKFYLSILKTNLNEIVSPFSRRLALNQISLTPTEIQVANLIKEGKTTKEIASFIMYISENAIDFHRHNIRKKLELVNKKINLRSYLQSI